MPLKDYLVPRDKFEDDDWSEFCFPCCCCKHRHGPCTDEPCRTCDHNIGAVDEEEDNENKDCD